MNEPIVLLNVRGADDGRTEVLSPGVGWWSGHPHAGALVGPGTRVGILEYQNRKFAMVLPDGVGGRLTDSLPLDRIVAVQYGEVLFRLSTVDSGNDDTLHADAGALGRPRGASLPEGTWAVVAPTDGVFYSRSAPDAPPFVDVGDRVHPGQTIGLVEVMKTFNQIQYGGPGFPDHAEVVEIRVIDAAEIRAGEVLVVVR